MGIYEYAIADASCRAGGGYVVSMLEELWGYLCVQKPVSDPQLILCGGSNDPDAARFAAELYHQGVAPFFLFSGGIAHTHDLAATGYGRAEALHFRDVARHEGVPDGRILIEVQARNTSENIVFSREVLRKRGFEVSRVLLSPKPFAARRALATAEQYWPEVQWGVASRQLSFSEYSNHHEDYERLPHLLVGEFARVAVYADKGYMVRQKIPDSIQDRFERLVRAGYDHYLPVEMERNRGRSLSPC